MTQAAMRSVCVMGWSFRGLDFLVLRRAFRRPLEGIWFLLRCRKRHSFQGIHKPFRYLSLNLRTCQVEQTVMFSESFRVSSRKRTSASVITNGHTMFTLISYWLHSVATTRTSRGFPLLQQRRSFGRAFRRCLRRKQS